LRSTARLWQLRARTKSKYDEKTNQAQKSLICRRVRTIVQHAFLTRGGFGLSLKPGAYGAPEKRSKRQSLQRMNLPGGYSKSTSSRSMNPTFRQMAFDGPLSADGKAWMHRYFLSARARSTTAAVALVATPWPWNSGSTLQPVSQTRSPRQSLSQSPIDPAANLPGPTTITNILPFPEWTVWQYRSWRSRIFSGVSGPPRCSVVAGSPISLSRSGRSPSDHGRMST
jgi:hypothetical protein